MGHPDLPRILEPGIATVLEPLLARPAATADAAADAVVGSVSRVPTREMAPLKRDDER